MKKVIIIVGILTGAILMQTGNQAGATTNSDEGLILSRLDTIPSQKDTVKPRKPRRDTTMMPRKRDTTRPRRDTMQ